MQQFYKRISFILSIFAAVIALSSFTQKSASTTAAFSGCSLLIEEKLEKCICPGNPLSYQDDLLQPAFDKLSISHNKFTRKYKRLNETSKRFSPAWKKVEPAYYVNARPLSQYKPVYFLSSQHAFLFRLTLF